MEKLYIKDDFIKLGQALKLAGLVDSGAEAKELIEEGVVFVNDEPEMRRGRKLYKDDVVTLEGESIQIDYDH